MRMPGFSTETELNFANAPEPGGLLSGAAARAALHCGLARPIGAGPLAFTLLGRPGGDFGPVGGDDLSHLVLKPGWAGLPSHPVVMGIVNVTPDSFSDGGRTLEHHLAVEQGRRMMGEGAAVLDIGGESTRPQASPVSPDAEQARILPVVEALAREGARISVDTRNAATMARALDAGAGIINDVSGLHHDPAASALLARADCAVILMHMRGTPETMAGLTQYGDVARDILVELGETVRRAVAGGIARERIAVDPGFGFAKTAVQSRELLQRLPLFFNLCCPIIAGLSRKRFIGGMANVTQAEERDAASVAAALAAVSLGATVVRVHAVKATVEALAVWQALNG